MPGKQLYKIRENGSDLRENKEREYSSGLEKQTSEAKSNTNPNVWLKALNPTRPRILIICDDNNISKELEVTLLHAGFVSEYAKSMTTGCELARSGQFQVVVTSPLLRDGSWKRLADIDSHYRPGFVIILVATNFDLNEWGLALEEGAFDVLDALHELPKVPEVARRALWAAYLKGAGPRPEAPTAVRVS